MNKRKEDKLKTHDGHPFVHCGTLYYVNYLLQVKATIFNKTVRRDVIYFHSKLLAEEFKDDHTYKSYKNYIKNYYANTTSRREKSRDHCITEERT